MVAGYIQPGAWLSSGCPSRLPGLPESTPSIQVTDGREYNVQLSQISNQTQDGVSSWVSQLVHQQDMGRGEGCCLWPLRWDQRRGHLQIRRSRGCIDKDDGEVLWEGKWDPQLNQDSPWVAFNIKPNNAVDWKAGLVGCSPGNEIFPRISYFLPASIRHNN